MQGVIKLLPDDPTPALFPILCSSSINLGASVTHYAPKVGAADKKIDEETNKRVKAIAKKRGI